MPATSADDPQQRCTACGSIVPAGSRFCPFCGRSLVEDDGDGDEERRVVSVVFADLVGFTALSEGRDPESVKELLDECFGLLVPIIEAHGGHIDKLIGDEIMATFGAPVSFQDDPERAVRAALELGTALATADLGLQLRIGVNTGEVMAGTVGPAGAYTVTGDAVNTAHRLAELAAPGEVIVGEQTFGATRHAIAYEQRDPVHLRGRSEPVSIWVARSVRMEASSLIDAVGPVEFIGRETEMEWLASRISSAFEARRPSVVSIVGEPGVGKTRLVDETLRTLDLSGVRIVRIRCRPYGGPQRGAATADVVRGLLGVEPSAGTTAQVRAVDAQLPSVADLAQVPMSVLRRRVVPLIDPEDGRRTQDDDTLFSQPRDDAASVIRPLLVGVARVQPTLLVLDDLHWAEHDLLRVLEGLPGRLDDLPVVIVCVGRAELIDHRPGLFSGSGNMPALVLEPLGADDAHDLLDLLVARHVGDDGSSGRLGPDAESHLVTAAGGNPLLLEEMVSFLADQGDLHVVTGEVQFMVNTDDLVLPDGIRALLWARIDALPPRQRRFLLDAAVVGARFWPELVTHLAGGATASDVVSDLIARGLIEHVEDRGDGSLAFRHRLAREAAYAAVPLADRAHLHAMIARWIQTTMPDSREHRVAGVIAHHVEQAVLVHRDLEHTDPGLASGAFRTLVTAGREAERFESLRGAERWYRRALHLGTSDVDDRREASRSLAHVLIQLRRLDEAVLVLDELQAELGGDPSEQDGGLAAEVVALKAVASRLLGDVDAARAGFDDALRRQSELADRAAQARTLRMAGWAELLSGRPRRALPRLRRAAELLTDDASPRARGETYRYLGWCEFLVGEPTSASVLEHAAALLWEAGDIGAAQWCVGILGYVRLQHGDVDEVASIAEMLIADVQRRGESWSESICTLMLAAARLEGGNTVEAAALLDRAARWFLELGDLWGQVMAELVAGTLSRATGNLDRAAEHLKRGMAMAPGVAFLGEEARLAVELSRVLLDTGDVERARHRARSALAMVRSGVGSAESEVGALGCLAECDLADGDSDGAVLYFEEALAASRHTEGLMPPLSTTRQAAARLATLHVARGELDRVPARLELASTGPTSSLVTQALVAQAKAALASARGDRVAATETLDATLLRFAESSHVLLDELRAARSRLDEI